MELLKRSMLDLLKILHKDDRLCIIEFDHRGLKLSPLYIFYFKIYIEYIINNCSKNKYSI